MSEEKFINKKMKCFYHSADLDGHCSGAIIKRRYPECEMIGINYGQEFPWESIEEGEIVFMVDFSLQPFSLMERLNSLCKLIWIDHHKTAIDAAYEAGFLAHEQSLEVGKAGCELTWVHIYPHLAIPEGVYLLGRYDVWDLAAHPNIMKFQYGMRSHDDTLPDSEIWEFVLNTHNLVFHNRTCENGEIVLDYQKSQSSKYAKACAFDTEIVGLPAIAMNVGMANSQMFESVFDLEKHKIMMPFVWKDGKWTVSLYTVNETGIDVGLIAKSFGGGGHKQAAGFQCSELPFLT